MLACADQWILLPTAAGYWFIFSGIWNGYGRATFYMTICALVMIFPASDLVEKRSISTNAIWYYKPNTYRLHAGEEVTLMWMLLSSVKACYLNSIHLCEGLSSYINS